MNYNIEYINLKYTLINCFLVRADKNVLDISYSIIGNKLTIQVVLLEGQTLSMAKKESIKISLVNFDVVFIELRLTKEQFNNGNGEWQPSCYDWLDYLLFSKAEVI